MPWGMPVLLPPDAPRSVTVYADCKVPDGNNGYTASVALKADDVRKGTYIQLPIDNNKPAPMVTYH